MIIGLSAYAQSGKDTVADVLVSELGFVKTSFAGVLRDCMAALNPIVEIVDGQHLVRYNKVVNALGYESAKVVYPEVRQLLQRMGTEVGREILGENIWVDSAMSKLVTGNDYVFTDVRFDNEFQAIKNADGYMVRIIRPGVTPVNSHPSETSLDNHKFDLKIYNHAGIDELAEAARNLPKTLTGEAFYEGWMNKFGKIVL